MLESEKLKVIYISVDGIKISSFSVLDRTFTFEIHFNDGVDKQVYKTTTIEEPYELSEAIITDLVRMEENINMEFDGEQLVGNVHVIVNFYDETVKKIAKYLEDIQSKVNRLKVTAKAEGYVQKMTEIKRTELYLTQNYF